VDEGDACDVQQLSKRQKQPRPVSPFSYDTPNLLQADGGELVDDDFTMSFMLDLAALTPTVMATSTLHGDDGA
jgi:hypothetical protein